MCSYNRFISVLKMGVFFIIREEDLLEVQYRSESEDGCPCRAEVHAGACVIDPIGPAWHLRTHPKPWVEQNGC